MKQRFLHLMMLSAMMIFSGGALQAQTDDELITAALATDMASWSFASNEVKVDNRSYYLDDTNGLAEYYSYISYNEEVPEVFAIPAIITYQNKKYVVVSMANKYGSGNGAPNVKQLVLPKSMRRLGRYSLYQFPGVHEFTLPESVEYLDEYVLWRENYVIRFKNPTPPETKGKLSSSNHLKLIVPAASFKAYHDTDYLEDCCVIADDLTKSTYHTGQVDNGELGYIVVANQLPNIVTYSDVNKLIIDKGTIDQNDWYQIRQMRNLVELDISGLSIEEIPATALKDCWQIERVYLNKDLRTINGSAFYNTGVHDLILPEGLTTITGSSVFQNCDSLRSIVIPEGVVSLPSNCFYDCGNLNAVHLPSNLTTMESSCFNNCDLLELNVPGSLKVIPSRAFAYNYRLASVTLNEGLEKIGTYAFTNSAFSNLILPSTVRQITDHAFESNTALSNLQLNEGLEEIDDYAFSNCTSLTEITLPSSLRYCLYYPFYGCSNITRFRSCALIPPTVRSNVISYQAGNIELGVPLWSFQEYMTTPGWLEFQDHLFVDETILPENIVINKEFEFVLTPEQNNSNYKPNIRMLYNDESIDDGFGHTKYERGNLTVSSRSKLNVNNYSMYVSPFAKYDADHSRFYNNYNNTYDSYRTQYNPNSLIVRGEMRAQNQTYNLLLCNDLWQFISFPFDVNMSDIAPVDPLTQWVIRRYDGAARAAQDFDNTWVGLEAGDILEAGKGYVMKCYNNDSKYNYHNNPVEFTLTPVSASLTHQDLFNPNDREITLEENTSEFEQNRSWNLIGNPYPSYFDSRFIDTDSPFLVWDSYNKAYVAFSPIDDDYILNPGEAFFIQRPVDDGEKLLFLNGGRQTYRNPNDLTVKDVKGLRAEQAEREVYNLTLSNGELTDRTRVVVNEKALMKYEISRDAAKFMASDAEVPQLWTVGGSVQYAINERPLMDGVVELGVYCGNAGFYTIALTQNNAPSTLVLEDRLLGNNVELTGEKGYSFNADAGTATGRFFLHISDTADGIKTMATSNEDNTPAYNLAGQPASKKEQGIIIKDGKKLLKK